MNGNIPAQSLEAGGPVPHPGACMDGKQAWLRSRLPPVRTVHPVSYSSSYETPLKAICSVGLPRTLPQADPMLVARCLHQAISRPYPRVPRVSQQTTGSLKETPRCSFFYSLNIF